MLKYVILIFLFISVYSSATIKYIPTLNPETLFGTSNNQLYCQIKHLSKDILIIVYTDEGTGVLTFQFITVQDNKIGTPQSITTNSPGNFNYLEPLSNGGFVLVYAPIQNTLYINIYDNNATLIKTVKDVATNLDDAYSIIVLDGDGFAVVWTGDVGKGIYYRVYDANGNSLADAKLFNYQGMALYSPSASPVSSTSFLVCFKGRSSTSEQIMCTIMGVNVTTPDPINLDIFTFYMRERFTVTMGKLMDGNYAVAYSGNQNSVSVSVITADLKVLLPSQVVSDSTVSVHPRIVAHKNGYFGVIFDYSNTTLQTGQYAGQDIVYQRYDSSYKKVGLNSALNTFKNGAGRAQPSAIEFLRFNLAACWTVKETVSSTTSGVYYQLFTPDTNCRDVTLYAKAGSDFLLKDGLTSSITTGGSGGILIYFVDMPPSGTLVNISGAVITANTGYKIYEISYNTPIVQGNYTFTYYTVDSNNNQSSLCQITIGVCYPSCETCSVIGSEANNSCTTCKIGYALDINSNCTSSCNSGYYFDTSNNTCNKCLDTCLTCNNSSSCVTCNTGYLKFKDICVATCSSGYVEKRSSCILACDFLSADGTCTNCLDNNQYYYNNSCLDTCPKNLTPDSEGRCQDCSFKIVYKGYCYDSCPDKTFYDSTQNTCYTCEDKNMKLKDNICVPICPVGSGLNQNNVCESCKTQDLYSYDNLCVKICPFGTSENNILSECDSINVTGKIYYSTRCLLFFKLLL
jgi:hypothetical protein